MNILLSTDNNYVMPTGVLMHSIGLHNARVNYYVLVNPDFSPESRNALVKITKQYSSSINFYTIDNSLTKDLPIGKGNMPQHVSLATYYRLFLTKVLPDNLHKILYLDGDMIVRKNISDLWNVDLKGKAIGVVHDMDEKRHANLKRLSYPMETGYFNAGMMLINLDYWREHHCLEQFVKFINNHGHEILYHDQDVLNGVLYNQRIWVPITYNFQSGFLYKRENKDYPIELEEEVEVSRRDAAVVHFSTPIKPWMLDSFQPYTAAWRYYKAKSQWKKLKLLGDNPKGLKEYVRNFLVRHNIWNIPSEYIRFTIRK